MIFNSAEFIIFFAFVYVLYRLLNHKGQNQLLLAASYLFYGCWDWRFLSLLWASTLIDYYCGQKIHDAANSQQKKRWLILSVCVNLFILGFFKYFNFFSWGLYSLLTSWGMQLDHVTLKVLLPVGVSFYTFQSISYVVDIYQNKLKPERDILNYALFVAFFPQLVAGPIERATHMLPQHKSPREMTPLKNKEGLWFIGWGFFLKVFVGDNMAKITDIAFSQSGIIPGIEVLLGSYAFAFQIFGDFAGYSYIALGISRLLGYDLTNNFLFPYFVTNPSDFWKNWHISLSSWLRDYLYIPLGGNRQGKDKTYRNLLITMVLGGLWHGAAWTFVIWGFYQAITLIIHRVMTKARSNFSSEKWIVYLIKVIFMFQITCLGWLIFRAKSLCQLKDFLYSLFFNLGAHSDKAAYMGKQIVFYSALFLIIHLIQKRKNNLLAVANLAGPWPWIIYLVMFYFFMFWGEFGGKQFIYFQF